MRHTSALQQDAIITRFAKDLGGKIVVDLVKRGMRAPNVVRAYLGRLTGQVSACLRAVHTRCRRPADPGTARLRERFSSRGLWLCRVLRPVTPACGATATRF